MKIKLLLIPSFPIGTTLCIIKGMFAHRTSQCKHNQISDIFRLELKNARKQLSTKLKDTDELPQENPSCLQVPF